MLDCEARRLTSQTRAYYGRRLRQFLAYCHSQNITRLEDISAAHLRAYFAGMVARGLAEDTQATAARVIRTFLRFCVAEELLTVSPMAKVRLPRPSKRILPAYTPQEIDALLEAAKDSRDSYRDTALILTLLDTGLRVSELVKLDVADVDTRTGAIRVIAGKGKKDRTVFAGARTRKALLRYLMEHSEAALFTSQTTGERLTHWGMRLLMGRLGARAGLEGVTCHKFRRTFCLWSLRAGMDIVSLSRIMGHEDVTLVRRYAAQLSEDLQAAHAQHGPVDNLLKRGKR
jgi:integrase/recombinase XerC/integrase/recombinase XerD